MTRAAWLILLLPVLTSAAPRWAVLPALAYTPETGVVLGAFGQAVEAGDSLRRERQAAVWLTGTTKRQAEAGIRPEWWSAGNRWAAQGELSYQFWPSTWRDPADGENTAAFAVERCKLEAALRRQIAPGLFLGPSLLRLQESFIQWEAPFPHAAQEGLDTGLGLELAWDKRDSGVWPTRGVLLTGRAARHTQSWGAGYSRWLLDGRAYGSKGSTVWAGQLAVEGRGGEPGYRALPKLGEWLRAYEDSRWLGRWALAGRLEARKPVALPDWSPHWLAGRAGVAAFIEAGTLADQPGELGGEAWRPSLGLGGRLALVKEPRLNARCDLAWGTEGLALRIKVGEEF
jgi:hypothetical protein